METVAFCEYDKKAQLVLKKHWPEVPIYDDVRELTGKQIREEIGSIDLICGGFPCQPFSVAGKQRGDQDDRHLWPEYFRLIQEIRPRWVIGENVTGLIDLGLDQVLSNLESSGYSTETFVIPACAVNAPHRRDRLWIVANSECSTDIKYVGDRGISFKQQNEDFRGINRIKFIMDTWEMAPSKWQSPGHGISSQPTLVRGDDGISSTLDRLKQLGNAVVPQVVEVIGRAIMEIEKREL